MEFGQKAILITGATGFVGANLARRLILQRARVHVTARPTSNFWRLDDLRGQFTVHHIDLSDADEVRACIDTLRPAYVIHLAAYGGYPTQRELSPMLATNVLGTANLLTALAETSYERFVYSGSSSEYGYKNQPMNEADVLEPASFYAATKAAGTHLCQVYARTHGQPATVLRLFSVYGYYEEPFRFIPTAIRAALLGETLGLHTGEERRDYVFIDDVVDALVAACSKSTAVGEVLNVGSGVQYSTAEVAGLIGNILGKPVSTQVGSYAPRPWETQFWVADASKSRQLLGWQATHTLERGLAKTIAWFAAQPTYQR